MLDNEVPPKAIEGLIAGIVGCCDDREPPLMLRWTKGDIVRRNRDRRLATVIGAMAAAAALVKPGQVPPSVIPAKETAPREEENIPIIT
jgi:hypothetical protein